MFNEIVYRKVGNFIDVDYVRQWMREQGQLWFYIDDRYYFLNQSRNRNADGEWVDWWYAVRGDYREIPFREDVPEEFLAEFYDFDQIWRAPVFGDGKSFERNFDEFVFYD